MHIPIEPYLAALRNDLATTLMPAEEGTAKRVATYARRMLTQLLVRANTLPAIQQKALVELAGLVDELSAALRPLDGGPILLGDLLQHLRVRPDYLRAEPVLQSAARMLAMNPSDAGRKLLRRLAAIMLDAQNALNQAVLEQTNGADTAQSGTKEPLDATQKQALQTCLRGRFAVESRLEVGAVRAIVGGGSKATLFVELRHAEQLPETIVLRVDQATGLVGSAVVDEFEIIRILFDAGVPVPEPLAVEADASIIGAPFIVVRRIEGHNLGDPCQVDEPSRSFALGLARAMARMHAIAPQRFGDRIVGAQTPTAERIGRDIASFETAWRNSGQPSVALELAYAWLKDHLQFAEGRRALNHCDLGCHNMLAHDGQLTAILDWETAAIGNPAHDFAYAHFHVVQMMPWEDFCAEYEKAGGELPSDAEFDFYRLWTAAWRVHWTLMARSFFHSGISSAMYLASASQHLYQLCEHELHKALDVVLERY